MSNFALTERLDFTTVVAVDKKHLAQLKKTWPTWLKYKPEILLHPLVVLYDNQELSLRTLLGDNFPAHLKITLVPVPPQPQLSQRAKMLSAFVQIAPACVQTKWLLKIDTDVVATTYNPNWCNRAYIEGDKDYAFVASPWGYTKPPDAIDKLDSWATERNVPGHNLNLHPRPEATLVDTPGRVASWLFFGKTDFLQAAAKLVENGPLPVPSHDTYLWYLAHRLGLPYRRLRMKMLGWEFGNDRTLDVATNQVLWSAPVKMLPHRQTLLELILRHFPNSSRINGLELGVHRGETAQYLLEHAPNVFLNLVDSWATYEQTDPYYQSGDRKSRLSAEEQLECYLETISRLAKFNARTHIRNMSSAQAQSAVADATLDFVFIDADHTYAAVKNDLRGWWPKIAPGGFMSGDDYLHPRNGRFFGVKQAVDEFVAESGLKLEVKQHGGVFYIPKRDQ